MDDEREMLGVPSGITTPECLGQIARRHCKYCSTECPASALCVLIVMEHYLR
jgi:hypothetical protein